MSHGLRFGTLSKQRKTAHPVYLYNLNVTNVSLFTYQINSHGINTRMFFGFVQNSTEVNRSFFIYWPFTINFFLCHSSNFTRKLFFPNNLFVVEIFAVPLIRKMLNFHTHLNLSLKHCENYLRKLHHISSYIETQSVTNCITDMRSSVCVCVDRTNVESILSIAGTCTSVRYAENYCSSWGDVSVCVCVGVAALRINHIRFVDGSGVALPSRIRLIRSIQCRWRAWRTRCDCFFWQNIPYALDNVRRWRNRSVA